MRALRTIQHEQRPPTRHEQEDLAGWSGWGAVPEIFDEERKEHHRAREQLRLYLTGQEFAAAARSTINAHYTDAALVTSIWAGVRQLGFTGGQVLEPGCGSGNFIGFAPPGAQMTGVEVEPVTAAIAAALYPDARIVTESFAATRAPDAAFDLVIGNVPFGSIMLNDRRHNPGGHSIHNHFIIKSLHLTRPGGIVALLTSRFTMDARNQAARREIAALADLLGAVRLPTGAHQRAAGTKVVTDLLILRRREPGRELDSPAWERSCAVTLTGTDLVPVSEYFLDHPEAILGELTAVNGAYRAGDLAVRPTGDLIPSLDTALTRIAGRARDRGLAWVPPERAVTVADAPAWEASVLPDGFLEAHLDGTFTQVSGGHAEPFPVPRSQAAELRTLLRLRDTAHALLSAEAATPQDTPDTERLRRELGVRYDGYLRAYGPLNRFSWRRTGRPSPDGGQPRLARVRPPQGGFRADPLSPLVFALEDFDPVTQRAARTAIFTQRVIAPRTPALGADTSADALAICLDTCGEVRLGEIARLLGTGEDQARQDLGALVFGEPGSGRLVPAAEYLSGQVREKLHAAEQAAAEDSRFAVNVAELRKVVPRDLTPGEIDARLGAAWIGADHVQRFLREVLDDDSLLAEHPGGQIWTVRGKRHTVLATSTWGTDRFSAPALAQAVCEQRVIEVRDKIGEDTWVLNPDATLAAQEKAAELGERFSEWVWEDPARAEELARIYNERFNGIVLRSYDDVSLTLPGLARHFEPRPHQVAAVARIIHEPAVLLAHDVGAGKTAEMVMGAMELRRLGLARKPAVVVPNHMLEQFAREWLQLYPQARVLVAQREDLRGERRRQFVARCATGDWDGIIMSRSAFERIPMSAQAQQAYLDRELDELRAWIAEARKGEGLSVKRLEAILLRVEERLRGKLDRARDPGITFEATGVDYLGIDEAHGYKNLRTPSSIRDGAIDGSMRASDLDMKIDYLRRRNGARVVAFATATPIANSVTEAYVMQRYLRPDLLEAAGIAVFDTWAATFGQVVTEVELAPEGGNSFRLKSRFARFRNVPEMLRMWHVSADVKTADDLRLPVPLLAERPGDGQRVPETVITAPSDELLAYVAELGKRAEAVRGRAVPPDEDNMLKITGDGRKAALDLRLVGLEQVGPSKVDAAAGRIAGIWEAHRDDGYPGADGETSAVRGSLQLVFCDLGTPGDGWNVYDYLRGELVLRGVPREQIRFVHEARTDRDKAELFAACRAGRVAVLVGSTEKMGVGTNVQTRAIALHHLDAPWRPADVAQREGRILRQGNLNGEVRVYRHVVRQSFDGYLWQTLERKSRFIAQVMRGRLDVREIEDIGDATLSYTEVKALATGNPLLMDKARADAELTRLERAERAHHRTQDALRYTVTRLQARIDGLESLTRDVDAAVGRRRDTRGEAFAMEVDGAGYRKRAEAGQRLKRVLLDRAAVIGQGERRHQMQAGELGGFPVTAEFARVLGTMEVSLGLDGAPGSEVRMTLADLSRTDPAGLVIRLENRLARLEDHKAGAVAEIGRLRAELAHANDSIGQPFAQASLLASARDRSRRIEDQLRTAAESPGPVQEQQVEPGQTCPEHDGTQGGEEVDDAVTGVPESVPSGQAYGLVAGRTEDGPGPVVGDRSRGQDHPVRHEEDQPGQDADRSGDQSGPADQDEVARARQERVLFAVRDQHEDQAPDQAEGKDQDRAAVGRAGAGGESEDVMADTDGDRVGPDQNQVRRDTEEEEEELLTAGIGMDYDYLLSLKTAAEPPPAGPLTDTDIAVALRRMPVRDFTNLLCADADAGMRLWSATIHGSRTSRGQDQPDPGAFDEMDFGHTGVRMKVTTAGAVREGFLAWREVSHWLKPGLTDVQRSIISQADHALTGYRTAVFTSALSSADLDTCKAAVDELTGILAESVQAVIDTALHAHEQGGTASSQQKAPRDLPGERALSGAPGTGLSDEHDAVLKRIGQLTSALPGSRPGNTAISSTGQGMPAQPADPDFREHAMDGQPEHETEAPASAPDAALDQDFEGVIDALAEHVRPALSAPQQTANGETFADIRAAFRELREVLGLPQDDGFHPGVGSVSESDLDATSIRRLNDALAEARACASWYRDDPQWQRITKVGDAARALLTAIREAAGDYWAEVSQDIRVRGFVRTVTARTARAISVAAEALATRLDKAGYGHTRAGQAARALHRCAARCADWIVHYPTPSQGDTMSEVATVIAELRQSPQRAAGNGSRRTIANRGRLADFLSPSSLARNCFPGSPKPVSAGRRGNQPARRAPTPVGRHDRQRTSSWRPHR